MKNRMKVLAVLMLALMMINMLPVKRAEAAVTILPDVVIDKAIETNYGIDNLVIWGADISTEWYFAVEQGPYNYGNYSAGNWHVTTYNGHFCLVSPNWWNLTIYKVDQYGNVSVHINNGNSQYNGFKDQKVQYASKDILVLGQVSGYTEGSVYAEATSRYIEPLVLPVNENNYNYWIYHKTSNGEYMYWSRSPFDIEATDGGYLLNLHTGDIVYRLHMNSSHPYYRQVLGYDSQYLISSGDVFRPGYDITVGGTTINAWTSGDVTSQVPPEPTYTLPHITKFLKRIRGARSKNGFPRNYYFAIDVELSGEIDPAFENPVILIDGSYILPSQQYFLYCNDNGIDPSVSHFMGYVKAGKEEYYQYIAWTCSASFKNQAGLLSDYGFDLNYSGAVDALIENGQIQEIYSDSILTAYSEDIRKMCCPYRLACTVTGDIGEETYFSDTFITVLYNEIDSSVQDVSGVYKDYITLDSEQKTDAIEDTINNAQSDKLQEYIDKKDAELEGLIEEYEMKLAALEGTLQKVDTDNTKLFGSFSDIANGIGGLSNSFRALSVAVGNVFAFFPQEIMTILIAGFVMMLIIGVYHALRG